MNTANNLSDQFKEILDEALKLHLEKNAHFKSQFVEDGEVGVMIRLKDKLNDIKQGGKPTNQMDNKTLEDWLDCINYCTQGAYLTKYGK